MREVYFIAREVAPKKTTLQRRIPVLIHYTTLFGRSMKIRAVEQRKQAAKVRVEKLPSTFRSTLLSASPVVFTPPPLDASKRVENPHQQRPIVG